MILLAEMALSRACLNFRGCSTTFKPGWYSWMYFLSREADEILGSVQATMAFIIIPVRSLSVQKGGEGEPLASSVYSHHHHHHHHKPTGIGIELLDRESVSATATAGPSYLSPEALLHTCLQALLESDEKNQSTYQLRSRRDYRFYQLI